MKKLLQRLSICFLVLSAALLSGCELFEDTDTGGHGGLSKEDYIDAVERSVVLPGMTPKQVTFIWGEPRERRTVGTEEQWIYTPTRTPLSAGGLQNDVHVTVAFVQGKVDHVTNGDLMAKTSFNTLR